MPSESHVAFLELPDFRGDSLKVTESDPQPIVPHRALFIVYVLKDDLKRLWHFRLPTSALRLWRGWRRRALRRNILPLRKFTAMREHHLDGILSHCRYPSNSPILGAATQD